MQDTDSAFGTISGVINSLQCLGADPGACVEAALALVQAAFNDGQITVEENQQLIDQAQALLVGQGGDVQVTLTWGTTADIDLWVTDPSGERIYFGHPTSASGGQLDLDDRDGFGPENIFWPTGAAPVGSYIVQVDHFSGASPSNYLMTTVVQGVTRNFYGSVSTNETDTVTTFTVSGAQPASPTPNAVSVPLLEQPVASK